MGERLHSSGELGLAVIVDDASGGVEVTVADADLDLRLCLDVAHPVGALAVLGDEVEARTAPQDLTGQNCINLRLPTHGGMYAWEFEKGNRELKVRVDGQLIFNSTHQILKAALAGLGLAYAPEDMVQPYLATGQLIRVLEDWCEPYSGYHLYYPSRRHPSRAFALLVEALRWRG
jgi:DNA-binding transcriptional LysR family regulator